MAVHYRPVTLEDYERVRDLLLACGVEAAIAEESRLRRMISNADRTAGAFDEERLVGFASALCDEAFYGSIGALCVHPNYRQQGIGTALVAELIEDSPEITWLVRGEDEAPNVWLEQGFTPALQALEKPRTR